MTTSAKKIQRVSNMAGDTIVEVMVAITIIGLALGMAYGLTNRSYHTAQNTTERTQALALAQGQIEFLKNLSYSGGIGDLVEDTAIKTGTKFCFKDDDGGLIKATGTNFCQPYGGVAEPGYNLTITYCYGNGCSPEGVFTISADWNALGGGQNHLSLYYKLPQSSPSVAITPSPPSPPSPLPPPSSCQTQNLYIDDLEAIHWDTSPTSVQERTLNLTTPLLPTCTIDLIGETRDSEHPDASNNLQLHEQVYFELYDASNPSAPVYTTGLTPDIPNSEKLKDFSFPGIDINERIDYIKVKHVSIHPDCEPREMLYLYPQCRSNWWEGGTNSVHGVTVRIVVR